MPLAILIPDLVCLAVCLVAMITDLRSGLIPNWLTFPGILLGLALGAGLPLIDGLGLAGVRLGLLGSVSGLVLLGVAFGLFALLGFVKLGDVKLMAAVGALLRWPNALLALVYVSLAGGLVALVYALATGRLLRVLRNIFAMGRRAVSRRRSEPPPQLHPIPYALAIFLGSAWAVAARYFPAIRWP